MLAWSAHRLPPGGTDLTPFPANRQSEIGNRKSKRPSVPVLSSGSRLTLEQRGLPITYMQGPADFSAELILVCDSLDAGGIERVVSTLANEWSRLGRKVSVVTLHDNRRFYTLDPAVHHVIVENGSSRLSHLLRKLRSVLVELRAVKPFLIILLGPALYSFIFELIHRAFISAYLAFETLGLRRALRRIDSEVVVSFGTAVKSSL